MLECYINIAGCELDLCEVLFLVGVQISLNSVEEGTSNKNHSKFSQCQQFVLLAVMSALSVAKLSAARFAGADNHKSFHRASGITNLESHEKWSCKLQKYTLSKHIESSFSALAMVVLQVPVWGKSRRVILWFFSMIFSCPQQLNRWPCLSLACLLGHH